MFNLFKRNTLYVIYYKYTYINSKGDCIDGDGHTFCKLEKESLNSINKLKVVKFNIENRINKENLCKNATISIVNIMRLK